MEQEEPNFRRNYYSSEDSGKVFLWSLGGAFLAALIVYLACYSIASAIGFEGRLDDQLWYLIPSSLCAPIAFFLVYILYNKFHKISQGAVNVKFKIGSKNTFVCILIALVALFGIQYFIGGVDYVFKVIGYPIRDDLIGIPLDNVGWLFVNLLLLALLPAVFEEIIYRGMILSGLRKTLKDGQAIFLSAVLFALMHGNLQQLVYPILLGLVFGWLVVRTGSTFSSILVHFLNNALVVLMAFIENVTGFSFALNFANWWSWLLAVGLLVVTFVILFVIDKFYFKHKNQQEVTKFEGGKLSNFVWIALGVGGLYLILNIIVALL